MKLTTCIFASLVLSSVAWFEEKCRVKGEFRSGFLKRSCTKSWSKSGRCAWIAGDGCMTNCNHPRNQNRELCDSRDCLWSEAERSCSFDSSSVSGRTDFCGRAPSILRDSQLTFCRSLPTAATATELQPLKQKIDIMDFMGCWYVQANIPTFLDRGSSNNIELYTWNEQKSRIDITFQYTKDGQDTLSYQKGFLNNENNTLWRLHPRLLWIYWPFNLPYVLFYVDENFTSSVIGYPDRSYLWIMTREVNATSQEKQRLIGIAKDHGYREEDISMVQNDIPETPAICPTQD